MLQLTSSVSQKKSECLWTFCKQWFCRWQFCLCLFMVADKKLMIHPFSIQLLLVQDVHLFLSTLLLFTTVSLICSCILLMGYSNALLCLGLVRSFWNNINFTSWEAYSACTWCVAYQSQLLSCIAVSKHTSALSSCHCCKEKGRFDLWDTKHSELIHETQYY